MKERVVAMVMRLGDDHVGWLPNSTIGFLRLASRVATSRLISKIQNKLLSPFIVF